MRFILSFSLVAGLALSLAPSVDAASFTVNFCPGDATCPAGITEASLTFFERMDTADVNDYYLDLTIAGTAAAPQYVDIVSFKIDAVGVPAGYEALPTLVSAPGGATWATYFDNVSGNATACTSNTGQQQAICSNGSGPGVTMTGSTHTWRYDVDLAGTYTLAAGAGVNLRAAFLGPAEQRAIRERGQIIGYETVYPNAGLLSPGGGTLTACAPGDNCYVPDPCEGDCGEDPVPEPTSVALLGVALLGASAAARRRR